MAYASAPTSSTTSTRAGRPSGASSSASGRRPTVTRPRAAALAAARPEGAGPRAAGAPPPRGAPRGGAGGGVYPPPAQLAPAVARLGVQEVHRGRADEACDEDVRGARVDGTRLVHLLQPPVAQ